MVLVLWFLVVVMMVDCSLLGIRVVVLCLIVNFWWVGVGLMVKILEKSVCVEVMV